jgi:biopolymer transport protein ExbD
MKKKRPEASREISMASTSDVAFLLLIFFIVTTIFAEEQGLIMVLPAKQKKAEDTVKVAESNVTTIKVHYDNHVTLDGAPIEINGIKNIVESKLAANPKLVVVLEIHPDADYGKMVACLDELRLANAAKVSLKTTKT